MDFWGALALRECFNECEGLGLFGGLGACAFCHPHKKYSIVRKIKHSKRAMQCCWLRLLLMAIPGQIICLHSRCRREQKKYCSGDKALKTSHALLLAAAVADGHAG